MSCAVIILISSFSEYRAVSAYLTNMDERHILDYSYDVGKFTVEEQTWDVIIIESRPGNRLEVEQAIKHFNPDVIIHIGFARGIKGVTPGDVVISTKIHRYKSSKNRYKSSKIGEDFRLMPEISLSNYGLEQIISKEDIRDDWLKKLPLISPRHPRIFVAPIITGERVTASSEMEFPRFLFSNYKEDVIAITTEDIEIIEVLCIPEIHEIVIRGIYSLLDLTIADYSKERKSKETVALHTSAFAFELLSKISKADRSINTKDLMIEKIKSEKELFNTENKNSDQPCIPNIPAKQVTQHQHTKAMITEPIRILHLSDLHIKADSDLKSLLQPLIADIRYSEVGLGFDKLDYLVISGDLTNYATPAEFERARQFISELIEQFQISTERCIIIPGNHDLSWEEKFYRWTKKLPNMRSLPSDSYLQQGEVFLIRNEETYSERFENFSRFYQELLHKDYSLNSQEQCISSLFTDTKIQFLAMNSCYKIDEHFQNRSGICPDALSRGLLDADQQIQQAKLEQPKILRIAVWHHPVTGNEKMQQDDFLGLLQQANYKLCLHGHIHEVRTDIIGYFHPRQIHVAGTGSFGAPVNARPESTPRLYNLLEIERDLSKIKVHTRCLKKEGGAWKGWAEWPGQTKLDWRTYYEIQLNET